MTHNNHFIPTILLLTLLTITTADQTTTSTHSDVTHNNLPDQCRESEFIDCSICPCPQLSSQYSASMLGIAGLSSALCFLFLIFMVLVKEIRQKPGDLVLGTIFAQIIFSVIFMIEKLAFLNPRAEMLNQSEADSTCTGLGLVKAASAALLNFYLLSFFAVYVLSIKNYLKISRIKSKYIHIAGIMITGLFCGILLSWRAIGLNPDGTCGMTGAPAILAPTVGYGVLAVFGIYLVYLARKNLAAARESLNETQADFVKHYSFYLKIMCVMFLAGGIIALTSNIKTSPEEANDHPLIQIFGFIQFIIINLCTIVLIVARLRDPLIYAHVKDYLRSLCCGNPASYEEKRKNSDEEDLLGSINDDTKIDISSGFISNSSLIQANYSLFQVHEDSCERVKKTEMLSSVLATLAYYWKQSHQDMIKKEMKERSPRSPTRKDYGSKKIAVTNSQLRKLVPQVGREIERRDKKLLYGVFSAALPELFQGLIERDDMLLELKDAWNFIPNYGNILSYGYHVDEFGKMVFLSSNGKYILQEITSQEKRNLVQALPAYYDHLKINPDSLLARIYGLFTFEAEDYASEIHMIVVKNVGECGWPGIERIYKIGSLVNNEAHKHAKKGGYVPLNEKDFEAYEGKLALDEPLKTNIMDILGKDVQFLQDNNMENYALQVSLVNKEKVSKEMVSSSVIIEVEESDPGSELTRGSRGSYVKDYLEGIDIEGINGDESFTGNTIKTYVGVVDFWRETAGKRSNLVWKTLRSLRPRSATTVARLSKYGETFLKYVDSIVV